MVLFLRFSISCVQSTYFVSFPPSFYYLAKNSKIIYRFLGSFSALDSPFCYNALQFSWLSKTISALPFLCKNTRPHFFCVAVKEVKEIGSVLSSLYCWPALKDYNPALPIVQYQKNNYIFYSVSLLFMGRVRPIFVIP